jgi:hypothetical protein
MRLLAARDALGHPPRARLTAPPAGIVIASGVAARQSSPGGWIATALARLAMTDSLTMA